MKKLMSISGARPARAPIHYTMSGLEDVWLLNGFAIEHTCYAEGVRIEDAGPGAPWPRSRKFPT